MTTTRLWVVESVWLLKEKRGRLPKWAKVVRYVGAVVPCSRRRAEERVWEALRLGQVEVSWKRGPRLDVTPVGVDSVPFLREAS